MTAIIFVTVHQNYIGVDGSREPYLLSVVQEGGAGLLRAILFNKMVRQTKPMTNSLE